MNQQAEDGACEHQRTGGDLDLSHDFDRLALVLDHRESGALPGIDPAVENVGVAIGALRQAIGIAGGAIAGAAMEDHRLCVGSDFELVQPRQRRMACGGNFAAYMFVKLPDVDEDGAAIDQFLGPGGRDVGKGHGRTPLSLRQVEGVVRQYRRCSSAISCSMRGSAMRYQRVWLSRRKVTMFSSRIFARCCDSADWLRPTAP